MKKLCVVLLILGLLSGCSSQPAEPTPTPAPSITEEPTPTLKPSATEKPTPTGNVFLDAKEDRHSTGNRFSPVRYTITVQKADALAATPEEYADFLSQRVTSAKSSGLAECYTMKFEDGTGVIYYGADPINANYGLVDETGSIIEPYGAIIVDDNNIYSYEPFDDDQDTNSETDASIQTLLENVYDIDGWETMVSVADGEANVWLSTSLTFSSEAEKSELLAACHDLYDAAENTMETVLDIMDSNDEYSLIVTLCSSNGIPLYCIDDGEVLFDLLYVG